MTSSDNQLYVKKNSKSNILSKPTEPNKFKITPIVEISKCRLLRYGLNPDDFEYSKPIVRGNNQKKLEFDKDGKIFIEVAPFDYYFQGGCWFAVTHTLHMANLSGDISLVNINLGDNNISDIYCLFLVVAKGSSIFICYCPLFTGYMKIVLYEFKRTYKSLQQVDSVRIFELSSGFESLGTNIKATTSFSSEAAFLYNQEENVLCLYANESINLIGDFVGEYTYGEVHCCIFNIVLKTNSSCVNINHKSSFTDVTIK